jgi:putative endonuclease
MFFVYVLYSKDHDRIYIGMTEDITKRIIQHNLGQNTSTRPYLPWTIVHSEPFETRSDAREKEIKLKTSSGRRFIRKNYLPIS